MMIPTQIFIGLALALAIGGLAYWRGSLSASGVLGATLVGTAVFGLGGWSWGLLLVLFFVSSSGLSHFKATLKEALAEKFSKGSRRDLAQTLANGGAGALLALGAAYRLHPLWWVAFVGVMATVNADTWATELGVLSRRRPRLLTTGQPVETGVSGGVTLDGTLAALAGAGLISLAAAGFEAAVGAGWRASLALALAGALGGLAGSLFDSFLGATAQAIYFCPACQRETERHPLHRCGQATRRVRGLAWLDNDWVNFLSSLAGGAFTIGVWLWLK